MMRPFFWRPGYDKQPPLTDEIIQQVESALGVKLPESYLEIMRVQNGGPMRHDEFLLPDGKKRLWIDPLMTIQHSRSHGIIDSAQLIESWEMPDNRVLLAGDGHVWLALDYRQVDANGEPGVVYIDNEAVRDAPREIRLAETFAEFLDGLVDGDTLDVIGFISKGQAAEKLAEYINGILGINLTKSKFKQSGIYFEYTHPEWLADEHGTRTEFQLNRNQYINAYPEFPQYDWLLRYEVKDSTLADNIFNKIAQQTDYEVGKVHTPLFR